MNYRDYKLTDFKKFEHIYINLRLGGPFLKDYTLYVVKDPYGHSEQIKQCTWGTDSETFRSLSRLDTDNIIKLDTKIPDKTPVFIAPSKKVSAEMAKQHYTIRRGVDSGDYNVFTPNSISYYGSIWDIQHLVVLERRKIVFGAELGVTFEAMNAKAQELFPDETPKLYSTNLNVQLISKRYECYKALIDGCKKPCVLDTALNLTGSLELNQELLDLTYKLASKSGYEPEAQKNYLLQLQLVTQHNWQDYPGTMALFMWLCSSAGGCGIHFYRHRKSQTKTVKELLDCYQRYPVFKTDKDKDMAKQFLIKFLNLNSEILSAGQPMYVSASALIRKLETFSISPETFEVIFKTIVKIQ